MNIKIDADYVQGKLGLEIAAYIGFLGTNNYEEELIDFLYGGSAPNRMDKSRLLNICRAGFKTENKNTVLVNIEDVQNILRNGGIKRYQALKDYIFILTHTDDRTHVAPISYNKFVKENHMSRDTIKRRMNNLIYKFHVISSSFYKSKKNGYSYKVYAVRKEAKELRTYNPKYHIDYTKDIKEMTDDERGIYFNTIAIAGSYVLNHPERVDSEYVIDDNGKVSYRKLDQIFKYFLRPSSEEREYAKKNQTVPRSRLETNHKGCADKFEKLPITSYLYKVYYNWKIKHEWEADGILEFA